ISLTLGLEKAECLSQTVNLYHGIQSACQGAVFLLQRFFVALVFVFNLSNMEPGLSSTFLFAILAGSLVFPVNHHLLLFAKRLSMFLASPTYLYKSAANSLITAQLNVVSFFFTQRYSFLQN